MIVLHGSKLDKGTPCEKSKYPSVAYWCCDEDGLKKRRTVGSPLLFNPVPLLGVLLTGYLDLGSLRLCTLSFPGSDRYLIRS